MSFYEGSRRTIRQPVFTGGSFSARSLLAPYSPRALIEGQHTIWSYRLAFSKNVSDFLTANMGGAAYVFAKT